MTKKTITLPLTPPTTGRGRASTNQYEIPKGNDWTLGYGSVCDYRKGDNTDSAGQCVPIKELNVASRLVGEGQGGGISLVRRDREGG